MLSLMRAAEIMAGGEFFSEKSAQDMYETALGAGWIDEDCFVKNPMRVLNQALAWTGSETRVKNVYKSVRAPCFFPVVACLEKKLPMADYTHFILLESEGASFDPLDPARPAAKGYAVKSYRVIV
jgi:hypothetical protein